MNIGKKLNKKLWKRKNIMNYKLKKVEYVGGYRLGDHNLSTIFYMTYKPKWIHRKMIKLFFGFKWIDKTI